MELSIPKVVPPTPPTTGVPPGVVGTPLIANFVGSGELTKSEVQAAGYDRVLAMGSFFGYQKGSAIYLRRLVLTLPSLTSGKRTRDIAKLNRSVNVCGSAFGTTMGSICSYLEGRGLPGEKASILRCIRAQLLPIAEALKSVRGKDSVFLSRGLASCRVAAVQRECITEPMAKIDSKYGNPYTCLGATAAIIACFGVMATVPAHAQHFILDDSLVKTLRCVMDQLDHWRSTCAKMPDDAWGALWAERRALKRATDAARLALYVYQDEPPTELLFRQLTWARIASFPANSLVNELTQKTLLLSIETQEIFNHTSNDIVETSVVETVPLSQIGEDRLLAKKSQRGDAFSDASSSWVTVSSNGSSRSCASGGSLDSQFLSKFCGM
tara:strand:+ start:826 stop:1971 length:1146 start_codon:yes stop_codon:yes gene_type:complete